ncbi:MAG: dihydrodipicolinate synthase family protein [Candidatus Hydrogenedentota bacterium]
MANSDQSVPAIHSALPSAVAKSLAEGCVIPAHPLALTADRRLDERRQRALTRYYASAGAGGIAIGVHTTQFAIRDPQVGLFEPVLSLAAEEMNRADERAKASGGAPLIRVGGVCGETAQAVQEAALLRDLGYHAGLVSLAAFKEASEDVLLTHCREVSEILPIMGFYLQPAVGGRYLPYRFWRRLAELPGVVAIKIAPFNRYYTLDVIRAIAEAQRDDIALYTGNDDSIITDLLTPWPIRINGQTVTRRMAGGLLGHWAVWTRGAVELFEACKAAREPGEAVPSELLGRGVEVTDANAAFFDAANGFGGCIAGIHEVLRRQGLLEGIWCLDPNEDLGPGQAEEIDRVYRAYPHLHDDAFVAEHLDAWLKP